MKSVKCFLKSRSENFHSVFIEFNLLAKIKSPFSKPFTLETSSFILTPCDIKFRVFKISDRLWFKKSVNLLVVVMFLFFE